MRSAALFVATVASSAHADGTVIARATEQHGGTWVGCGGVYAVGWVVFERIRVVDGDDPGAAFVAIIGCPADHGPIVGEMRLELRARKPYSGMPDVYGKLPALPRWFAVGLGPESAPETRRAARLMGRAKVDVERELPSTGQSGAWTILTPDLQVRYDAGMVAGLRVHLAEAHTCESAQEWIGYEIGAGGRGMPITRAGRCVWPASSERSRLARGVTGSMSDHWFEVDRQ
jgi:hypothetical protein